MCKNKNKRKTKKYKAKNFTEWKEDSIRNGYCCIEYTPTKAMLWGHGRDFLGCSIADQLEFYTIWTQAPSYKSADQHAEKTDSELIKKVWAKLRGKFTQKTTFSEIITLIRNEGVNCQVYNVMIG